MYGPHVFVCVRARGAFKKNKYIYIIQYHFFISIIMKGGGNDRKEARAREKKVYETTSESDVRVIQR